MDGLVIIGILVLGGLIMRKVGSKPTSGMEDHPITIENIRRGVSEGWYTCSLLIVNGEYAVRLTGRTANGKVYSDTYPIIQSDWITLQKEGYNVE